MATGNEEPPVRQKRVSGTKKIESRATLGGNTTRDRVPDPWVIAAYPTIARPDQDVRIG